MLTALGETLINPLVEVLIFPYSETNLAPVAGNFTSNTNPNQQAEECIIWDIQGSGVHGGQASQKPHQFSAENAVLICGRNAYGGLDVQFFDASSKELLIGLEDQTDCLTVSAALQDRITQKPANFAVYGPVIGKFLSPDGADSILFQYVTMKKIGHKRK